MKFEVGWGTNAVIEPSTVQPPTASPKKFAFLPPLVFAAVVLILLGDVLFSDGSRVVGAPRGDMPLQFLPWRDFGFRELRAGNLALWNPHIYGGAPFFGGFQSALLYPPNWLHLVLPLGHAINWVLALHVFLAGYFTYLWCRRRGASRVGATLAGGAFMLSGQYFLRIVPGHLPHGCAMVWTPLLLLAIDAWRDREPGTLAWVLVGMAAVAMQVLAGHPQYVYYTAIVLTLYAALLTWRAPRRLSFVIGFIAMYAGGALLSAVQLLAGMHAAGESLRGGGTPYAFARQFFLPIEHLLTLFAPRVFGDSVNTVYVGRWFPWETSIFLGVTTILLAGYGAVTVARARRRFAVTIVIASLLLALGAQTPLFDLLYRAMPGFASFRGASKFAYVACLFLALLAGLGFDDLLAALRNVGRPRRTVGLAIGAAAAAVVLAGLGFAVWPGWGVAFGAWSELLATARAREEAFGPIAMFTARSSVSRAADHACNALLVAAATAIAVMFIVLFARQRPRIAYGLPALLAIEMLWFAGGATPTVSVAPEGYGPAWRAALNDLPYGADVRVLHRGMAFSNLGMTLGYRDLWGYDPLVLRRYAQFIAASQGEDPDAADQFVSFTRMPPVFGMLRLRYFFEKAPNRPPVLRFDDPLPRLSLFGSATVVPDRDERLRMLLASDFDPRSAVVLERDPPIALGGMPSRVFIEEQTASTDHLNFVVDIDRNALLLITDNYSTGWRIVTRELPPPAQKGYEILPANHTLMAVPLAAGRHHLRLEYSPSAFRIGKWISLVSLAAYALAAGWLVLRRRRYS